MMLHSCCKTEARTRCNGNVIRLKYFLQVIFTLSSYYPRSFVPETICLLPSVYAVRQRRDFQFLFLIFNYLSMVKFIESELILLKKEIDEMWTLVYNQLGRAGEAVLTLDKELAQQVIVRERRVNAFELKIDSDVEDVIALYNPVAIDLRFVLAMLKINTNLERLGDFAEGIARFVLKCEEPALDPELLKRLRLEEMQEELLSMLEIAKRALNEESIELATAVFAKDNLLDEINAEATAVLACYIEEHPESILSCLNLVSVFRKLERSGDHITNIAEEIVFFIDAKVLKHSGRTDEHYPEK